MTSFIIDYLKANVLILFFKINRLSSFADNATLFIFIFHNLSLSHYKNLFFKINFQPQKIFLRLKFSTLILIILFVFILLGYLIHCNVYLALFIFIIAKFYLKSIAGCRECPT